MPKSEIDYSNTIIYKITCKDSVITDVYVGHTTNFVQRKHAHKQSCINIKSPNYKLKLYEVIRVNGGWDNWKMEIINFFDCKDHYEARKKEQEYFISLNANLNSIEPMPKPKVIVPIVEKKKKEIFECVTCNIRCNSNKAIEEHNKTKKHLKKLDCTDKLLHNSPNQNHCESCNITCSKQHDWNRHILTRKHKNNILCNKNKREVTVINYNCTMCNKVYKSRVGIWRHKKTCVPCLNSLEDTITPHMIDSSSSEIKTLTNLVLEMVKSNNELQKQQNELQIQNNELQKQMFEMCKHNLPSKIVL